MSKRYVRSSHYRHVHGEAAKLNGRFYGSGLKTTQKHVSANEKYIAVPQPTGGGPVIIHPIDKPGRYTKFFKVNVHKSKVSEVAFNPFASNIIATASEDAYVKVSVIPDADGEIGPDTPIIRKADRSLAGHYKKVDFVSWHPTASGILASASPDNTVKLWDLEKEAEIESYGLDLSNPTCLNWNSNGSLIAVGSKGDGKMYIYDPRQKDKAQVNDGFAKKADGTSYTFADNQGCIIGIGRSSRNARRYKVWDITKLDKALESKDLDQSSGVLHPHYDPDNSVLYLSGKGDSVIKYFELTEKKLFFLSSYSDTKPQKAVAFLPKRGCDVKTCEIAKAVRLINDGGEQLVPVSFRVPRKSDLFQKDLYPDTFAGVAGCDATAYQEGKDGEIKLISMKPGTKAVDRSATLAKKKSSAEYEKEIAELKAEVARLKIKAGEE